MNANLNTIEKTEAEALEYREYLYRVCYPHVDRDKEAADICVQETYLALEVALKNSNQTIENCRSWLLSVLFVNIGKHVREKMQNANRVVSFDESEENPLEGIDSGISVEGEIEKAELRRLLISKSDLLSEKENKLAADIFFNEKKLVEIAKATHVSAETIRKRQERLIKKLSKICKSDVFQSYVGGEEK